MSPMRMKFSFRARFRLLRRWRPRAGALPLRRALWHRRLRRAGVRITNQMLARIAA